MKERKVDIDTINVNEFKEATSRYKKHVEQTSEKFREKSEVLEQYLEASTIAREKAAVQELAELKQLTKRWR